MDHTNDKTTTLQRAPADRTRRALEVRVVSNADPQRTAILERGAGIIGRSAAADVRIDDDTVSQFHLEVSSDGEEILVKDLGSRNRTRAGAIVIERARVPSGTELVLGGTRIVLALGEPATNERSRATSFGALVGASPVMREVYALLEKLARSELAVVVEGPTGSGKELAARALHEEGPRSRGPFIAVSCASLPPGLAESVLFGDDRGDRRVGVFEAAEGGTVLLDNVEELPLELQAKLLRALDQREIVPVGAAVPRSFDARVVSTATNLRERVNRGAFREDLYFRLAQAHVDMPPLDSRREDLKPLALHFLGLVKTMPRALSFEDDALESIAGRSYAGNVRELRNIVERAAVLSEGTTITVQDLAFERVLAGAQPAEDAPITAFKDAKRTVIDDFEKNYLVRLLARTGKNVSRAAALAGIERQSLRDLMRRHGLRDGDDER